MAAEAHLLRNLLLFGRTLRALGLDVSPGRMTDLVAALGHVQIGVRSDFYHAARALLVHEHEDLALFDAAFEMFWQTPIEEWKLRELGGGRVRQPDGTSALHPAVQPGGSGAQRSAGEGGEAGDAQQVSGAHSDRELLRQRDFADLSEAEIDEVRRLLDGLVWKLGEKATRRRRPGGRRGFDLRRTLRRGMRHEGEVLEWVRRKPRHKPRPLVVICDISGSMERYTRLLLHFVYGLTQGLGQRVEAFAFGTRLTRLSRHLRDRDIERALAGVSNAVLDWSGGTRIGDCVRAFNYDWARRVMSGGAVVLLISDGWDRGEPELLAREMDRLHRSCHRLIWLNPLLGSVDYEPLTRGMKAALPHVDDFLPVHNLASLEALADRLSSLDSALARPGGRSRAGPSWTGPEAPSEVSV